MANGQGGGLQLGQIIANFGRSFLQLAQQQQQLQLREKELQHRINLANQEYQFRENSFAFRRKIAQEEQAAHAARIQAQQEKNKLDEQRIQFEQTMDKDREARLRRSQKFREQKELANLLRGGNGDVFLRALMIREGIDPGEQKESAEFKEALKELKKISKTPLTSLTSTKKGDDGPEVAPQDDQSATTGVPGFITGLAARKQQEALRDQINSLSRIAEKLDDEGKFDERDALMVQIQLLMTNLHTITDATSEPKRPEEPAPSPAPQLAP